MYVPTRSVEREKLYKVHIVHWRLMKECAAVIVESPLKAFLTHAQFWQAHLVSSSCLVISTDQSHTSEVAAILKHLYGNSLPNENVVNLILTRLYVPCPVSIWSFTNLPLLLQKHPGDVGASLFLLLPPLIIHSSFTETWANGAHQDRSVSAALLETKICFV